MAVETGHTGAGKRSTPVKAARAALATALATALVAAGVLLACAVAAPAGLPDGGWVRGALTSRLSVISAAVLVVSSGGLGAVLSFCWSAGASRRLVRKSGDAEAGGAMIEFAMVLPFALMFSLLMLQSSLLMAGNLAVNYAAYCAARSAIVEIPDGRDAGEPHNYADVPGLSGKHERIRRAAVWAVMPFSRSADTATPLDGGVLRDGLESFFDDYGRAVPGWIRSYVDRKLAYADEHTFVELDPPRSGDLYDEHEDIRVRVRHTLYLSVPYAGWLLASMASAGGDEMVHLGSGEYGIVVNADCVLSNEGVRDWVDIETFPG